MTRIGVMEDNLSMKKIIESTWSGAKVILLDNTEECAQKIVSEEVDGVLLMSYTAQKMAGDDVQNRISVEIVPGKTLGLRMGVNYRLNHNFVSLWKKTLSKVSENKSDELVMGYLDNVTAPNRSSYLFDHPMYMVAILGVREER